MYIIKQLKTSFVNLVFLGFEKMGENGPRLEADYKEQKVPKEVKDQSIKKLLEKPYIEPKLKTNSEIVKGALGPDYLDKDGKDLREIMGEKTKEELKEVKEQFGFSSEIMKNLTDKEKETLSDVLGKRTINQATSGEIYTLKQEGFDLAKIFLKNKNGEFSEGKGKYEVGDSFEVEFYGNKDIDRIVGIGDILDINNISKISVNGVDGKRRSHPRPGFYAGRYLAIHDNFNVNILEKGKFEGEEFNNAIYGRFSQVRGKELQSWIYGNLDSGDSSMKIPFKTESDKNLFNKYIVENFKNDLSYDVKTNVISTNDGKSLKSKQEIISSKMIPKNASEIMSIPGFSKKLNEICSNLGVNKNDLLIVIGAESNFDPKAINSTTGASGLIQFMPSTAKDLGTTISAIREMGAVEQLTLVESFYKKNSRGKKLNNVVDLYKSTFYPLSLEKSNDWVFGSQNSSARKIANQNPAISKHSTRSDGLIDGYAFKRYVMAKVSNSSIVYEDISNGVSDALEYDGKLSDKYINGKDKYNSISKNPEKYNKNILEIQNGDGVIKEIPGFSNMIIWELSSIDLVNKYALIGRGPAFDKNGKQIIFTSPEARRKKSSIQNSKTKEGISIHGSAGNDKSLIKIGLEKGLFAYSVLSNGNIIQNQDFNDGYGALGSTGKLSDAKLDYSLNKNVIAVELALPQKRGTHKIESGKKGFKINIVEDPSHNQMVATGNLVELIKFQNSKINNKEMFIMDSVDAVLGTDGNGVQNMHGDFFRDDFMKAIGGLPRAQRQKLIYERYGKNGAKVEKEVLSNYKQTGGNILV